MANPKIEVEIGAVIDGLRKGFGESVKIIETLENQVVDLDKKLKAATDLPTIQGLNAQLAQTKAALAQLKTSGIDPLTKATSNYNSVGTDFARIIQDAPFGLIGVGNNITQLAGSFQQLKSSTGSTGAAVKAALASILSPANALVLGVSVLTTAFTILQQKGFFKTEEAAKSLNEQLDEYRENLDAISQASIKGQANAAKEIQNFKLLQIQAENTNIPLKTRIEAVQELQKNYPDYLGNLTQEQILNGNVGESYKLLSESIIAKAKAQAFSNAISENALKIATFENQIIEKQVELEKARAAVLTASTASAATGGIGQPLFSQKAIAEAKVNDILKEQENLRNQISKVQKEDEDLTRRIVDLTSKGAVFTKDKNTSLKDNNKEKEKEIKLEDELINRVQIGNDLRESALKKIPGLISDLSPELEKVKDVKINLDIQGFEPETAGPMPFENFIDLLQLQLNKLPSLEQQVTDFAFNVNDLIKNSVGSAFVDLGYTIGETLASGGNVLKAIGGSVLKSFSNFLGQFGQQLIAYGVAASAFGKVSLALSNPGSAIIAAPLAIAAGIALTAIAGAIGSLGKKGSGGGAGGSGVGGGSAAQGTSFVGGAQGGLFAQNRDLNGELVVRGQDLVYVFNQASDRINKG